MKKTLIASLLICAPFDLLANDIYRCTENGKITFSQMPCSKNAKQQVIKDEPIRKLKPAQSSSTGVANEVSIKRTELYILEQRIVRHNHKIEKLNKKMDKELAVLKKQTTYANNNLAGANYQNALSSEMIAVTNKYKSLIDTELRAIEALQTKIKNISL